MGFFDDVLQGQSGTAQPAGFFADILSERPANFDERFSAAPTEPPSPLAKMLTDFQNQGSAAAQRTTPIISAQSPNLISSDVFQNDAGEIQYRDPATGQIATTDQNKQIVLRDPSDQKLKVYARTPDTNEGVISSLGRILGTGLATGAPTRLAGGPAEIAIKTAAAPQASDLKAAAQAGYQSPAVTGLTLTPDALVEFGQKLRGALNAQGLDENLAPKTFGIIAKTEVAPDGGLVTGQNIESLRRTFGNAASSIDPTERLAAKTAIDALDESLSKIPKGQVVAGNADEAAGILADARANYAAAKRSDQLTQLTEKAENNAHAANSGQNLDNATRQQIKTVLNNPAARRGYSTAELAMMKNIVSGSYTGDTLRAVGNLLGGGGGHGMFTTAMMGAVGGLEAGGVKGAMVGAMLPAVGYLAKKAGNILTVGKVEQLDNLIRSNSPLGRQMTMPVQQWSKVAQAYEAGANPKTYALLNIASRNLANNLKDAGITISPADLMASVQGTVNANADEKQQ